MRPWPILALGVVGCTEPELLFLAFAPEFADAESLVLAKTAGGTTELSAYALDETDHIDLATGLAPGEVVSIEALLYRERLGALGLSAGALTSVAVGRRIPAPEAILQARFDTLLDAPPAWLKTSSLGSWSDSFRLPSQRCAPLTTEVLAFDDLARPAFVIGLDARRAIVGSSTVLRLFEDGVGLRPLTVVGAEGPFGAGLLDGDTIVLGGEDGVVWTGRLSGGRLELSEATRRPSGEAIEWLAGGRGPDGLELVALGSDGTLELFVGDRWVAAHRFPESAGGGRLGRVIWGGPGVGFGGLSSAAEPVRITASGATEEPRDGGGGITAMADVPGIGFVLGDAEGQLFVRAANGRWSRIPETPSRLWVMSIAPTSLGFLFGLALGSVGRYEEGAFCPIEQVAGFCLESAAELREGLVVLAGTPSEGRALSVAIVRKR